MHPLTKLRYLFKIRQALSTSAHALLLVCIYALPVAALLAAVFHLVWPLCVIVAGLGAMMLMILVGDALADYINRKDAT